MLKNRYINLKNRCFFSIPNRVWLTVVNKVYHLQLYNTNSECVNVKKNTNYNKIIIRKIKNNFFVVLVKFCQVVENKDDNTIHDLMLNNMGHK
jgi:hypothetical protein